MKKSSLFKNSTYGFTLMETVLTITILGLLAVFAIPTYVKSYEKQKERDATVQLQSLHSAIQLYKTQAGIADTGGLPAPLNATNANLNNQVTAINNQYRANVIINPATTTLSFATGPQRVSLSWNTKRISSDITTALGADNPCCDTNNCSLLMNNCPF